MLLPEGFEQTDVLGVLGVLLPLALGRGPTGLWGAAAGLAAVDTSGSSLPPSEPYLNGSWRLRVAFNISSRTRRSASSTSRPGVSR